MFKMSEKADRYVGLVFWLVVVSWVWFIDQMYSDFSYVGEFNFDNDGTLGGKFFINIFASTGYDAAASGYVNVDAAAWLVIALWLSWTFRHIPMKVIHRMAKTFDKYV
jgi:hypothetical protein